MIDIEGISHLKRAGVVWLLMAGFIVIGLAVMGWAVTTIVVGKSPGPSEVEMTKDMAGAAVAGERAEASDRAETRENAETSVRIGNSERTEASGISEISENAEDGLARYQDYRQRLEAIRYQEDMEANGFDRIEEQIFPVTMQKYGEVWAVPALDKVYDRLVFFFIQKEGRVVFCTDQLESNYRNQGELKQPNRGIAAVSYQDINGDQRMDMVLIVSCVNSSGNYAGKSYKVGEVLFQNRQGDGFYRDYRISEKINRFGMNKSVEFITSFVREGKSAEFLYTAVTLEELLTNGLKIIEEQCYSRDFEKLGRLKVVPGTFQMADYNIFLIYLVNEQGYIVSSLQPMDDFDNFYALKGISCRDIDGDGMKDIIVLARYSNESSSHELVIQSDYAVYYQRTGGFSVDREIKDSCWCSEEITMEELVEITRAYWGWKSEK